MKYRTKVLGVLATAALALPSCMSVDNYSVSSFSNQVGNAKLDFAKVYDSEGKLTRAALKVKKAAKPLQHFLDNDGDGKLDQIIIEVAGHSIVIDSIAPSYRSLFADKKMEFREYLRQIGEFPANLVNETREARDKAISALEKLAR